MLIESIVLKRFLNVVQPQKKISLFSMQKQYTMIKAIDWHACPVQYMKSTSKFKLEAQTKLSSPFNYKVLIQ